MSKKCTLLWREAHFVKSKCTKRHMFAPLLDVQMSFRVAGARDCAPCQKWAKRKGFAAFPKTMAGVGHLKRICKDAFSVAGAVQETSSSELLSVGLLKWFCVRGGSASYDLASDFSWQAQYSRQVAWKNRKTHWYEAVSSAELFRFWRKSRRIVSFLMLSSSKIEEVSQNRFSLDVVKFKNWGSLAELFRFWRCQVHKLRKSRKIAAFSSLQIDR